LEDEAGLLREVERHHPDILILDETLRSKQLSELFRVFQDYPDLRILVINPKENVVHVYENQKIRVDRSADLLAAIRGGSSLSNSLFPIS
jgi:DNA-binding NarL/FixJ family response regulator